MSKYRSNVLRITFIFVFTIALVLSVSMVNFCPVSAGEVTYKKKIVSVLFDNSLSMRNSIGQNENKTELAKYSLEMLAALLGEDDELYFTTMNKNAGQTESTFQIDLTAVDRLSEIEEKIVDNTALYPIGTTPSSSVGRALSVLVDNGLISSGDSSYYETQNTEYWLVMLTDGIFDEGNTESLIENYIKDYAGLNTIYLAFGSGAKDITDPNLSLNKNYPFSAYYIPNAQLLTSAMQDVANKISGRYGAETSSDQYTVSGKEIVINLDKFQFALNNIAVLVQDCGATLTSVTYGNKNLILTQKSELKGSFTNSDGDFVQIIQNGYVAVACDTECMSGGQVKFTFDKAVGSEVSVLVEPAIYIDAYLEREESDGRWVKTDVQEINSIMSPGDQVRVQYNVYNSATDEEISLSEIFGAPTEKITYCGNGYDVGEPIALEKGTNAISVTISVLNGSYTIYSNIICYIEDNPSYYRLEGELQVGEGTDYKKATAFYTLYVHNQPIDRAGLSDYSTEIKILYPDGTEHAATVNEVSEDGKMSVVFDGSDLNFGEYVFTAKVTSNETKLSRTNVQTLSIVPNDLKAECVTNDKVSTTLYLLDSETYKVEFSVFMEGKQDSFLNSIINYKLTCGNLDVTNLCETENGNLVFYISKENLPGLSVGTKTLKLEADVLGKVFDSASYEFEISNSVYAVEALDIGTRELDMYHLRDTQAAVYFKVYRDGISLSEEEINAAMENGEITIETNPFGWVTLLPCEVDTSVEQTEDGGTMIACRVKDDMAKPWDSLFSSFVFAKEKNISLAYNGVVGSDTIFINNLSIAGRIWRWCVLLAILLFIIHVVTFLIGFKVAKPLPKGMVLKFNIDLDRSGQLDLPYKIEINMRAIEVILWHISRFIPFREFKHQRPRKLWNLADIHINKKTKLAEFHTRRDMVKYQFTPYGTRGDEILEAIQSYENKNNKRKDFTLTEEEFMSFLWKDAGEIKQGSFVRGIYDWYGVIEIDSETQREVVDAVIHFVKYRRKRKRR